MFQYAFFSTKKMNLNVDYDISLLKHQNQHNGYELERIFDKESRSNCLNFFVYVYYIMLSVILTQLASNY